MSTGTVIGISEKGDKTRVDDNRAATPGTLQTLISYTVPAGKVLCLRQIYVNYNGYAEAIVKKDSDIINRIICGGANANNNVNFTPDEPITAGQVLSVTFEACAGEPTDNVFSFINGLLKEV